MACGQGGSASVEVGSFVGFVERPQSGGIITRVRKNVVEVKVGNDGFCEGVDLVGSVVLESKGICQQTCVGIVGSQMRWCGFR